MGTFELFVFLVTTLLLVRALQFYSNRTELGYLSLPCILTLTCIFYFIAMPLSSLTSGIDNFMGLVISSPLNLLAMLWLYLIGAFLGIEQAFKCNPTGDDVFFQPAFRSEALMWLFAVVGIFYLMSQGSLQLLGAEFSLANQRQESQLLFILQALNLIMPLTLIVAIRRRFDRVSLILIVFTMYVLVIAGFRYRIVIFLLSLATAYLFTSGRKASLFLLVPSGIAFFFLMVVFGAARQYGAGINLENIDGLDIFASAGSFGAEIGVALATAYIAENPPSPPYYLEPWIIGFTRLVPSFLWPGKPEPVYLSYIVGGTDVVGAETMGIAFAQPGEILLQFGFAGVLIISAIYFFIGSRLSLIGRNSGCEYGITLYSICPAFFGYYMVSRGYFFQILADGLFTLGAPLLLMWLSRNRRL